MKTDSQIMNDVATSTPFLKPLSDIDSAAQKRMLLDMLKDIVAVCDANGIDYMLGGGSCLGAVRHGGFIPWDDDLDIMIPRNSYDRLLALCYQGVLGDKYEFGAPSKSRDNKNTYLKIYKKDTLDLEIFCENAPFPNGIFVDIFPMDFAPKYQIIRRIKGYVSDIIQNICTCVFYAQYPSKIFKEFMFLSPISKKRYKQRLLIGKIFNIISHKNWIWFFDRFNANSSDTGYLTIPSGRNHYFKETQKKEIFLPPQKSFFEGIEINLPADYHTYLSGLYGGYMEIPPIEKRERHMVYRFSLLSNNIDEVQ